MGHVTEVFIQQPTADLAGEVWVRVTIDISARLIFARFFYLDNSGNPVLIRYNYDMLRKFCSSCGSFTHQAATCNFQFQEAEQLQLPAPSREPIQNRELEGMNQMETLPHTPTKAADDTMGETVGSNCEV